MPDIKRRFEDFLSLNNPLRVLILCLSLITILAGCRSQVSPPPSATATSPQVSAATAPTSCIIGIWEINDKEAFLHALLPAGSFDPEQLKFIKTIGSVAYRFDTQGVLTVEAVGFQGRYDVRLGTELGILDVRLAGFASGKYELSGDAVEVTEMLSSDMSYHAYYQGEEMMADVKADAYLPLFVAPFNKAGFECSRETLAFTFINHPGIQAPLEFKRLR